ncbi:MAG: DNA gyrase subunit B, partial [Clostridia bacterium]|nr:DNA gyrase subunit B [Clostridia bacterium]
MANDVELLQPQEEAEVSYNESDIQVLEGLEAVRKRPGMYIGSTGPRGLHHLVYEIVDNSIDEALAGYCSHIEVEIEPGDIVSVRDNGRGIPVGINEKLGMPAVTVVLTVLHAGGKFGGGGYKVAGGLHGVGSSVVNALSEWLEVEVSREGHVHHQRFEKGHTVTELKITGDTELTGTLVRFKADPEIFTETTEYDYETLQKRLREQAFLNAGLSITFTDRRDPDNVRSENYCYEGGISSFVEFLNKTRGYTTLHDEVIHLTLTSGGSTAEVAFQYNDSYNENIVSFANNMNTVDGGTHEVAFKTAITRIFNDYAVRYKMFKDDKFRLKGDDVREGIMAVVSVKLEDAQFESQTKAKLGNTAIGTLVNQLLTDKLTAYLDENPSVAKVILEKSINSAKVREAAQKARDNARNSKKLSSFRMPDKLADCIWRDPERTEIYIVEGDSAGGSAKQGRDRRYQAILPIRGKFLNVEKARLDKVLQNAEIRTMITAVGTGIGTGEGEGAFNLERLRYHKIVIMTDADVDGSHIRTLLLTFFYRQMPELVKRGHIYIAQPPLYQIVRKKRVEYVEDDTQMNKILIQLGVEEVSLKNMADGRVFTSKQLDEILELLTSLDKYAQALRRHGGNFTDYVERIDPKTHELPKHFVKVRDGNDEFVYYFRNSDELMKFSEENPDLGLFGKEEQDTAAETNVTNGAKKDKNGNTRRATYVELHEHASISDLLKKLARKGLSIDHYSAQDHPLFELTEGEGVKAVT